MTELDHDSLGYGGGGCGDLHFTNKVCCVASHILIEYNFLDRTSAPGQSATRLRGQCNVRLLASYI